MKHFLKKVRNMRKSKTVQKQPTNQQQRINSLLALVAQHKQYASEHKLVKRFGAQLDTFETTLRGFTPGKNALMILLRAEKELNILKGQMEQAAHRRRLRMSLLYHGVVAIKVLIYVGAYVRLVPHNSLAQHPSIYIVSGIVVLMAWIGYFYMFEQSHLAFTALAVERWGGNNPQFKFLIRLTTACFFNWASFLPLGTAVRVFPGFINPSWDVFLVNMFHLFLDIFTSNTVTAVLNIIALLPFFAWIIKKIRSMKFV